MNWPSDDWWPPTAVAVVDGTELAVRSSIGPHRPVVLVHGLASNALLWRNVADALARMGHAVASVDLRGHGRSDRPESGHNTPQSAHDVTEVVTALGWADRRPLIAGQSWGGNVALTTAASTDVWGGVLCVDGGWIHLKERFPTFDECWAQLAPPGFGDSAPADVVRRIGENLRDWPEHSLGAVLGNLEIVDDHVRNRLAREHHRSILRSLWEVDPGANYPLITCPVHLMVAGRSTSPDAERAQTSLADATISWHPEAHHDIHLQHPETVMRHLVDLIERAEGSTST